MTTTEATGFFGTATKLANALGIEKSAVSQWGEHPPLGRQAQIQLLSRGKLKADPIKPKKTAA